MTMGLSTIPTRRSIVVCLLAGVVMAPVYLPQVSASETERSGHVISWGSNDSQDFSVPIEARTGVSAVAASGDFTVALKGDRVHVWRRIYSQNWIPVDVPDQMGKGVQAIAAGASELFVVQDGRLSGWGFASLRDPESEVDWIPLEIPPQVATGVSDVKSAGQFVVALKDGAVHVWLYERSFELWFLKGRPSPLSLTSGVDQITGHLTALKDGQAHSWTYEVGEDVFGWEAVDVPVPLAARTGVTAVAASQLQSLAVKDGRVISWAASVDYSANIPPVPDAAMSGVTAVEAHDDHAMAIKDGGVIAWGDNRQGQSSVPLEAQSGIVAIASGGSYGVAIKEVRSSPAQPQQVAVTVGDSKAVVAWKVSPGSEPVSSFVVNASPGGGNCTAVTPWRSCTVTGLRNDTSYTFSVVAVNEAGTSPPSQSSSAVRPRATTYGSGAAAGWGWSVNSQKKSRVGIPIEMSYGVTDIAGGAVTSAVVKNGGVIMSGFGYRDYEGGVDQPFEIPPDFRSGVDQVEIMGTTLVALKAGRVIAWTPKSWQGQPWQWTPPAEAQSGVEAIAAAGRAVLAVKRGRVFGWVVDWSNEVVRPMWVPPEAQSGVTDIAVGSTSALALKDGRVLYWGYDYNPAAPSDSDEDGQSAWGASGPVPQEAESGVTAIAVGYQHALALKNGRVIAWGHDGYGQVDVPATAHAGVTAIAAGDDHSLALREGGVIAWGSNTDGYNYSGQSVVPPEARAKVIAIAAGSFHSLAIVESAIKTAPSVPGPVRSVKAKSSKGGIMVTWRQPRVREGRFLAYDYRVSGQDYWNRTSISTVRVPSRRGTTVTIEVRAVNEAGPGRIVRTSAVGK